MFDVSRPLASNLCIACLLENTVRLNVFCTVCANTHFLPQSCRAGKKLRTLLKQQCFLQCFVILLRRLAFCACHGCTKNIVHYKVFCSLGADSGPQGGP